MAMVLTFGGKRPRLAQDVFLAPSAVVVGDVDVGEGASIWFGAVLRGDHPRNGIVVGPRTNIQDHCVIHVGDWQPTVIGADVTVGHGALFESCTIEDRCVVGMNAVILPQALVGAGSLVAAGAVVLEGTRVPPGSLVAGVPARVRGPLAGPATAWVERSAAHYRRLADEYLAQGIGRQDRCELCGGPVVERHCKLVCSNCGFQRDCSDP